VSPSLLSLPQVAQRLGVSEKTARQISGRLPGACRIGARLKFDERAIAAFIEAGGFGPSESTSAQKPCPQVA